MKEFTILVGRSASGKDAILRKLVNDYDYKPLISCTTRPKRDGEIDNVTYYFISDDKFKAMIKNDSLIEHRSYSTLVSGNKAVWYYGLPKIEVDKTLHYIVILDLNGAQSFIDYYGKDIYDIEFYADNKEYNYNVDMYGGEILAMDETASAIGRDLGWNIK